MILKPLNEDAKTMNKSNHIVQIEDLMKTFFSSNIDMTSKDISSNEVAINAYNLTIFTLLESNIDLQKVLDAYSVAFYMVNYVTKIEAGLSKLLREASEDIENGHVDLKQKLRKIANVFINGNILTSQEAVYHALSLPLCISSRNVVYINTVPINQRTRMLKKSINLKSLPKTSKDIHTRKI
ncbi:hypothetical protein TSAR_004863 [Trichomalopsis sarcophagae]|uniref:Uncharacterized protein n=1 Tax=Trichomalopsis sarcophagae TaxID=543379 RepID=A0A232EGE7_9HYME|nr:hypothetical protein TSAR_004863 [Trichomalopsis sarcophagae]